MRLQRVVALDIVRGIAAFMMVQGHFIYATVESHVPNILFPKIHPNFWLTRLYFFISENFLYALGWSMFFLVIGIGLAISIEIQKLRKTPFKDRLKHILKRTGFFILVQYIFNIVSYGFLPPASYETYILTLGNVPPSDIFFYLNPITSFSYSSLIAEIGLWSLVIFFLMELSLRVRIVIAIIFGFVGYYIIFLRGNMLVYILAGGIFGSYLIKESLKGNKDKIFKIFLLTGIVFTGIGTPLHIFADIAERLANPLPTNYADYLGSPGFILYSLGVIWILFALLYRGVDYNRHNYKAFKPFILLGNLTLTIYVAHYILLNQFLYNFGFNAYFNIISGWTWNFALIIFIYIASVYWSRYRFKYSLEWVVQKIR